MAVIAGMKLNADRIFSFGGQWDIGEDIEHTRSALSKYVDSRYINIVSLGASRRVMWFYSYYADTDKRQKRAYDEENGNVSIFAMNTKVHGDLVFPECYGILLTKEYEELSSLQNKYKNKVINKRNFCKEFLQLSVCWPIWRKDIIECHKSLQILTKLFKRKD